MASCLAVSPCLAAAPAVGEGRLARSAEGLVYELTGSGPAVVLVHGAVLDHRLWDREAEYLRERFRVLRYDLRGHGASALPTEPYSSSADLARLLDELELERAWIVGLSEGARIAIDFALESPNRAAGLLLVGPAVGGYLQQERPAFFDDLMSALEAKDYGRASDVLLASPVFEVPEASREPVAAMVRGNERLWTIDRALVLQVDPPAVGRLGELRMPVTVAVGEQDLADIHRQAELIAGAVTGARLETVPGGGHLLNMTSPDAFREILDRFLTAAAAGSRTAPAGDEAGDLPRHELVFARHGDAARTDYDIWRMCADGTQMASLVVEPGVQFQPSVSPDGREFVYASRSGDGQWDVWRRPFERGEAVNLTDHPKRDSEPAWSPDGGRIAFFSDRDHEQLELYTLDLASGSIERLTDNSFYDSGAAWSPNGAKIVWTRFFPAEGGGESAGEIFQLDLASGVETRLTRLGGYSGGLSYSPDGATIAFHRVAGGRAEIWLMDSDGSSPRPITDTFVDEYSPEWSPDGRWLAFTAGVGNDSLGTFDLWLMRPDGSRRQVLNRAANTEAWHKWRPGEHYCR